MIRFKNVKKQFGGQIILEKGDLVILPGERVGLIGSNGVGKTTVFKIIERLEGVDSGSVSVQKGLSMGVLKQELENSNDTLLEEVLKGNHKLVELREKKESLYEKIGFAKDKETQEKLSMQIGEIDRTLEHLGDFQADSRASSILMGLGFNLDEISQPLTNFSGGWKMRVSLARILFSDPDLLLLDEPTNHLDVESVSWLEKFLSQFQGAVVVISHDRHFLNRIVRVIVELENYKLTRYVGDFDKYLEQREENIAHLEKQALKQERRIAELERFIRRFKAKATKARQAKSREKELSKIKPIDKISVKKDIPVIRLPDPPNCAYETLIAKNMSKSFDVKPIFSNVNMALLRGSKIGFVGPNGSGKTTFLKMVSGELSPSEGIIEIGDRVKIGYFSQHTLDGLDENLEIFESAKQVSPESMNNTSIRSLLGGFLFSGDEVYKKVSVLSGGERARLALARLFMSGANLLLLDEPTNHLDMASRTALEEALESYSGTFILVAHDRDLIESVCEEFWVLRNQNIESMYETLDDYLLNISNHRNNAGLNALNTVEKKEKGSDKPEVIPVLSNNKKKEIREKQKKIEKAIEELEDEDEKIKKLLSSTDMYEEGSKEKLLKVLKRQKEVSLALKGNLNEWEILSGQIENF
ncbi:MAG: ABC-F family ATP-binding cassette domain-containing protein [Nitrospinota bacterium]|nr:ABC-F family ATP-binding cassette domain-containing protein [Nitrospinota bacterium]